ncbi:hypothetical protein CK510_18555 [Brunnivagina elsteri CCALA 953]|uniref:Uncharacterized protein n=1 Tax=Brunnivagina elsteri CCALA 953 TaxID=987040 RepID=A0A2A2TFL2_9CYAN|nr:hypothetical protein CK510_18555 [Calothrix elsteri CCALA 953]
MQQYQQKINKQKINVVINIIILVNLVITGCICLQFIVSWMNPYNSGTSQNFPTSLPWIHTKSDCEHRGRKWDNNKCWDSEHSMFF